MTPDWDDLRAVLWLVRGGSLAAAGKALNVSYTTVARRVARAEKALGQVLFERLADGYRPTEAGLRVASHAAGMEAGHNAILRDLAGRDTRLTGDLIVTAPQLLIGPHLANVIREFHLAHPGITLHVRATNELLDLSRRDADLAIRVSNDPGDSLTGRRLTTQHQAAFGAPELAGKLRKNPRNPVPWLVYAQLGQIPKAARRDGIEDHILCRFDDMGALMGAAVAGLGAVRMPMFLGRATHGLEQLPLMAPQPYSDIWVVAHRDVWPSAKVQAFNKILIAYFRKASAAFVS